MDATPFDIGIARTMNRLNVNSLRVLLSLKQTLKQPFGTEYYANISILPAALPNGIAAYR
jgi:hypothetical protein